MWIIVGIVAAAIGYETFKNKGSYYRNAIRDRASRLPAGRSNPPEAANIRAANKLSQDAANIRAANIRAANIRAANKLSQDAANNPDLYGPNSPSTPMSDSAVKKALDPTDDGTVMDDN